MLIHQLIMRKKMKIFKYDIPIQNYFELQLPKYAIVLSFQVQKSFDMYFPKLWVLVNEEEVCVTRKFYLFGTGQDIPHDHYHLKYVGTIQHEGFVWHLFEETI